jgi:hypothetical protein
VTFSDWYAANVKPQLEESLARLPAQAREPLRTASRQAMAACWNAALDSGILEVQPISEKIKLEELKVMTFEQWWAHEKWDGIDIATVQEAAGMRQSTRRKKPSTSTRNTIRHTT